MLHMEVEIEDIGKKQTWLSFSLKILCLSPIHSVLYLPDRSLIDKCLYVKSALRVSLLLQKNASSGKIETR